MTEEVQTKEMQSEEKLRGRKKFAVVLFNLGGPDDLNAVQPFLFNLFSDPAILSVPNPIRYFLAKLISSRRTEEAKEIYGKIGGKSPILDYTRKQASALEMALTEQFKAKGIFKVFTCMRYWHPMSQEVAKQVKEYAPDEIFLLPLYPQFSTTTTDSSFKDWAAAAKAADLYVPTKKLCCYPIQEEFIFSHATLVQTYYDKALEYGTPRVLFTAHGLPKKVIEKGDPYQWQVEQTAHAVIKRLGISGLDYRICYQSRVGPLEWIQPYTEEEIIKAAKEKKPLVIVPIAFVSDHSETLVELDMQYRELAAENGLEGEKYFRVPGLNNEISFIQALTNMCGAMITRETYIDSCEGKKLCPDDRTQCMYYSKA